MRNGVESLHIISMTGPGDAWPRNSRSYGPVAHHVRPGSAQSGETRRAGVESFGSFDGSWSSELQHPFRIGE